MSTPKKKCPICGTRFSALVEKEKYCVSCSSKMAGLIIFMKENPFSRIKNKKSQIVWEEKIKSILPDGWEEFYENASKMPN